MRFAAPWMAPWVSLALALSYWHLSLSRLGFRAITLPLVLTIAVAFLFRALRRLGSEQSTPWSDLLLAGFVSGLSLYTYTAGRVVPVLITVGLGAAIFLAPPLGLERGRLGKSAALILGVMTLTMLPLLIFFVRNPYFFAGHAIELSVMTDRYAGDSPFVAMAQNAGKFILMFFTLHDREIRHDPALRPVIDWVMGLWLVLGMGLGIVYWRRFTLFFFVLWISLLAAPSLLSAQGAPQSLRAIGMMPALFVLPVAAMLWAGFKLAPRQPTLALLMPLPFVLITGVLGVRDYFTAFANAEAFRMPFLVDYVALGEALRDNPDDAHWIIPLASSSIQMENRIETVHYIVDDPARFQSIWVDPARVSTELQRFAVGGQRVNVLDLYEQLQLGANASFFDSKQILAFLLGRDASPTSPAEAGASTPTGEQGTLAGYIPYKSYVLDESPDFALPGTLRKADVHFADTVKLAGLATGSGAGIADHADLKLHSDGRLWAVLGWQALRDIDFDLKTSLVLLDAAGDVVAQVDGMLNGDGYPVERTWQAGDTTRTYHLLEPLPGTPPGHYTLALSVYEDESGRIYPAATEDGGAGVAQRAILGDVELLPPLTAPVIAPQFPLTDTPLGAEIALAGFDLARDAAAPGETLGLALYWTAALTPTSTYSAVVELVNDAGVVALSAAEAPGGSGYPTSVWTPGFAVRDLRNLSLPATLSTGQYALRVRLVDGARTIGETNLGEITVGGRPHVMQSPAIERPLDALFGDEVRLLGVNRLPAAPLAAGEILAPTFIWQPQRTSDAQLVRTVQILDAAGTLVAQQDAVPCADACPATSWLAGEYLLDRARTCAACRFAARCLQGYCGLVQRGLAAAIACGRRAGHAVARQHDAAAGCGRRRSG